jgi:hypothetical protein
MSFNHTDKAAASSITSGKSMFSWAMPKSRVPKAAMVAMLIANSRFKYTRMVSVFHGLFDLK